MIKQRRGDALPLRRKNYEKRAAGKEQGRGRGGIGLRGAASGGAMTLAAARL